ncbi:hypothetical protein [Burkholderia cenocepacia]|uniref:hypothetical protein n=1 Tax=Burkholderia cenocepacia TaxID=95486 RepID=UPI002238099F|nr:hypothetical protein [Burkholderia cenocepacia]MCW5156302.1 hypothetical protein [Burkholderia cenocepacia]
MAKTKKEIDNVNLIIVRAFQEILSLTKSAIGGDAFDKTVYNILHQHLKKVGFDDVSDKIWKKHYTEYKALTGQGCFDFNGVSTKTGIQEDSLVVDKPNGSQKWPDILVVFNKIGFPIEIKSSKDDLIVWNSGLPQPDRVYVFGCYDKGEVTIFMGEDVLSVQEYQQLKDMDVQSKALCITGNSLLKQSNSKWSYYPRPMYNSNEKYFSNPTIRKQREDKVFEFLKNMGW